MLILQQLGILYIFLLCGWFFGKIKKGLNSHTGILSFLLVNLFLPCKVFKTFSGNFTIPYLKDNYLAFIISTILLILLVFLAKPTSKLLTKDNYEQKVFRYSIPVANYAYMGYTLIENALGEKALTNMILFCIPFAIYTYTFGYALLTDSKKLLKKLINPMSVAILLGIISGLAGIKIPSVISAVLDSSSSCVGATSMLLTGIVLSEFPLKNLISSKLPYVFSALRLIIVPLFVYLLCKTSGMFITLPEAVYPSAVIMACMPCGLNTVVFPKLVEKDCTLGAKLAFVSHLFSLITLPVWISILI